MLFDDEGLARTDLCGRVAHQVISQFAGTTLTPSPTQILSEVDGALAGTRPVERRALRQNVAGAVARYFRELLPPAGWVFIGSEMHLGPGRVDLVWKSPTGLILLDEVKTGHPRTLETTQTREQVHSYLTSAKRFWPDHLYGLRLVSTYESSRSVFIDPAGLIHPVDAVEEFRSVA